MRQDKVEFLRNSPNIYGLFLSPLLGLDVPSYASRPKIDDSRLNLTSPFGGVSNFAFETPPTKIFEEGVGGAFSKKPLPAPLLQQYLNGMRFALSSFFKIADFSAKNSIHISLIAAHNNDRAARKCDSMI
ncbi:MAG: hypothetical protein IJW50_01350 [Clostridia bacterium]|nr:hypothetical protein [Clostridia bacterium]